MSWQPWPKVGGNERNWNRRVATTTFIQHESIAVNLPVSSLLPMHILTPACHLKSMSTSMMFVDIECARQACVFENHSSGNPWLCDNFVSRFRCFWYQQLLPGVRWSARVAKDDEWVTSMMEWTNIEWRTWLMRGSSFQTRIKSFWESVRVLLTKSLKLNCFLNPGSPSVLVEALAGSVSWQGKSSAFLSIWLSTQAWRKKCVALVAVQRRTAPFFTNQHAVVSPLIRTQSTQKEDGTSNQNKHIEAPEPERVLKGCVMEHLVTLYWCNPTVRVKP